ncbi:WD repeat-containing protein 17 isoform X2 [Nematostella vectensis]|uniref:WD repeat-containing protein 17 isoform X2 n=1 Tax=Nematostella vectensis TaxID=45351 RepID=UPI0020772B6E|nr:WD repeat-containing protein 17 isoform X2 [Nematostella vectensis]
MSVMRQVGLLAAGCQPWNLDVCSASSNGERFAYCATLAIYVYEFDHQFSEYRLISILADHRKTITAIAWNPHNEDILASAGADCRVLIWSIKEQKIIASLQSVKVIPSSIGWCLHELDSIAYVHGRGPIFLWNYTAPAAGLVSKHLESVSFFSDICQFRWHPRRVGKIGLGHADGSLSVITPGSKPFKHCLRPDVLDDPDTEDPVTSLEWDPLSTDYLLVTNACFGVRLIDSSCMSTIMNFKLPSAALKIHTISWVPTAPGMFVTGDTQAGALRIWTVAKSTPVATIRLKKTGFHALAVIATQNTNSRTDQSQGAISSTSEAIAPPSMSNKQDFTLPPAHILCTFLDGGVGLYDLGKRRWSFLREMGHVETIFDCKFKADDADMLATASFDGTVKVWDVDTLSGVHSSPGNEGIIYALSWAPGDLNAIAGATAKNGVFIWDIGKGKIIKRFLEHGKSSVYNVSWNHKDSQRIASVGADGNCIVRRVDGTLIKKYKHPGAVYGCDWSLNNRDMLATGCEDSNVRVYYVPANTDQPLKVFPGHTAKVFHVKWSPLREGLLCSGSDDRTIRVWDYTQDNCILVLEGHMAPVRGLLWNPEIPFLLISGSWDYTIRVWDIRDGTCMDTILDHGADVYGLTCHRHRPFTVASCSRDSTLRIWSLSHLSSPLLVSVIAKRPWKEIAGSLDDALVRGAAVLLTGRMSRDLQSAIEKAGDSTNETAIKLFSDYFLPPCGTRNLWQLVSVLSGEDENLSTTYGKGIIHSKHLVKYKASEAQELETAKLARTASSHSAHDDRLTKAALIHVRVGQLQRYCELMVQVGQWDKALAVAPGVSMEYWKTLIQRRAEQLVREDDDAAVPYCVATGDADKLVSFFTSRGQLHDAFLVAQVACEGGYPQLEDKNANKVPDLRRNDHLPRLKNPMNPENVTLLQGSSTTLAEWYFSRGLPVQSASCHLAVGNTALAMSKLVRGNELELAVSMALVMKHTTGPMAHRAVELLARKCEKHNRWEAAVALLRLFPNTEDDVIKVVAKFQGTVIEINELHEKAGLPGMDDCLQKAEELCEQEKFIEAMKYYLLSSSPELTLDVGLNLARAAMGKQYWVLDDVLHIVEWMACVRTDRLQQSRIAKQRQELVALSAYVGAVLAMRRHYTPIVYPLLKLARQVIHRDKVELGVPSLQIQAETEAWLAFNNPDSIPAKHTPEQKTVWDRFSKRIGTESGVDLERS